MSKTKINRKFWSILYLAMVVVYFIYVICSLIYNTKEGLFTIGFMALIGTFSYVFLMKKANKEEGRE